MKNASRENAKSWVIAAICCFINFLHLGIARQSGLLYLAAISRYEANRNQASLPFVLCYTVRNVSGPFVGFLGRKVGLERVTIFGCLLASVGMGACFLAEDILTVTLLWGVVFGLGFGMGSVLIPVVLNQHFDKHLSNANGLAFGGECVAGFILPILLKILLNTFGTSGLFLILSGLMLHSVPAAMLLKMSTTTHSKSSARKPVWVHSGSSDSVLFPTVNGVYNKTFNLEDNCKSFQVDSKILNGLNMTPVTMFKTLEGDKFMHNDISSESLNNVHNQRVNDSETFGYELPSVPQKDHLNGFVAAETIIKDTAKIHDGNTYGNCESVLSTIKSKEVDEIHDGNSCQNSELVLSTTQCNETDKMQYVNSYRNNESVLSTIQCNETDKMENVNSYRNSESVSSTIQCNETDKMQNVNNDRNSESVSSTIQCNETDKMQNVNSYRNRESVSSTIQYNETETLKVSAFSSFRVFYDPAFILMLLTQSSFIFIGTMVMTIIVDLSSDAGVTSDEEIYILMCLSISDMIGRFGLGWVTDSGYMSTIAFSSLCYFSLGVILTALAFLKGFILVMCAAFFIGLFLGGLLIVCPGVVSDHIEKEKITMALASRFVLYAPMSLTQSSLIGFFRGTKGSYNGILYMLTVVCLLCCAMSLSIPFASRKRENSLRNK